MATTEELEKEILAEMAADPVAYAAGPVNDVITIDGETRMISVPASEIFFGVESDKDVERKHFRCPKVVGDGIDLSKHQIYISYITSDSAGKTFSGNAGLYLCEDVATDGDDITFSWQLSGNVFASAGFIAFKVLAAKTDGENVQTRWNTVPAIGTVLMTVPDGMDIGEAYPDIVTQLLERMASVEKIATEEAMQGYVNTYLEAHPGEIDETLTDPKKAAPASVVGELKEDLDNIDKGNRSFAIIKDEYVNLDGEIKKTDENWDRTDYIEVNDELVIISKSKSDHNCFFDSTKKFVSTFLLSTGENKFIVPNNVKYIICSNTSDAMNELIVKSDNTVKITNLENDLDNIDKGNRSFAIIKDEYVNLDGEIKKTDENWDRTDYIEVNDELVIISKSKSDHNCFFDSTKKFVSTFLLSTGENKFIVPNNVKYIICSNTSDAMNELIVKSDNTVKITNLENDTGIALKSRKNLIGTIPNKLYPIDYKANENITFSTKGLVPVTKSHIFYFYDENKEYVTDYALYPPFAECTVSFDKDAKYISLKIEQEYPIQVEYGKTATEYEDYWLKSSDLMARITDLKEDYLLKSSDLMARITVLKNDTSIITLNKQLEPFVIQSTATKASGIGSSLKLLTFIHFSDWHNVPVLWERLCDYMEAYKEYIQFALHTGDYCGGWQGDYTDAYLLKNTTNPILNCVGNHDTYTKEMKKNTQESTYKLLFNHIDNWGVTFGSGNNTMYYYKDFPDSEIRLIVLDCYYDIDNQKTWLEEKLNEAKTLNYAVITAMHEVSKTIVDKIQCTFQTLDNYESAGGNVSAGEFDTIIKAFKDNGGVHIVNLCGHEHDDMFGYTSNGVLNLVVECATTWNNWTGGNRIKGTKTYDCFNVFSVEKDTGVFKVVRIGDNSDHYLRAKNVLSYDYINKKVLHNA